jgi:predicted small secreted protein
LLRIPYETKQKAESDDPIRLFYEGGVTGPKTGDMKKFKAFASCLVQFEYTIDL